MQAKKIYAILNFIAVSLSLILIYFDRSQGNQIQETAAQVENLLTPAPYAFSIWGIIYISLFIFSIHQLRVAFRKTKDESTLTKIGPFLILSLIFNGVWVYVWTRGYQMFFSPALLFASFFCLLYIILKLHMQTDLATRAVRRYTWLPISIYAGWMMAASVVGVSSYFSALGLGNDGSAPIWTVVVIIVIFGLYFLVLKLRNMTVFSLVGVWTFIAIAVQQWHFYPVIAWTALSTAMVLFLVILVHYRKYKPYC